MQVAVDHRTAESFGQGDRCGHTISDHHSTTADHDWELRASQEVGRFVERTLTTGSAIEPHGGSDLHIDVAIEAVTGDVELRRTHLR